MNIKIILAGVSIFLYASFDISVTQAQVPLSAIRINEIAWMGTDASQYGEWIELYNSSSSEIDLKDWKIYKKKNGVDVTIVSLTKKISPNGYYLIERTTPSTPDPIPGIEDDAREWKESGLSNSGEFLILKDASGDTVDSVNGSNSWKINGSSKTIGDNTVPKKTAQYIDATWQTLLPTPKMKNGDEAAKKDENKNNNESSTSLSVRLSEVFPDPSAKGDTGEFIELYNFGMEPTDISGWKILDASALKKKSEGTSLSENDYLIFPNIPIIDSGKYFVAKDIDSWFHITLNNTSETLSLFDKSDILIDSMHFDKTTSDISLNYTLSGWRGGTPTPGMANRTNSLPETREKVPKKGYRGVTLDFDARGRDTEHDHLKYTWNFGDGHKSYKETTTHKYEENGTYIITLKVSDGKDDILETFTLEIISLPHPEVRIVALLPNPAGNDTGNEWLLIENREKKKINLKGYSIATGWKNLVNHPLREDFFIKPKKQAFLRNPTSLFTLPNQKGKIELRAPDGKVLQDIKYKLDKSIADDVVYRKEKGSKWKWDTSSVHVTAPSPSKEQNEKEKNPPLIDEPMIIPEMIVPLREEMLPEEIIKEKEMTSPLISLDPDRPLPQDILTYGTALETPHSLILAVPADEKIAVLPLSDSSSVTSEETPLLIRINATLNDFLNTEN